MAKDVPFREILDRMRSSGRPVGVDDYIALGKLVSRYDGASREVLREAIASLVGRDREGVALARSAFDELFPETVSKEPPEADRTDSGPTVVAHRDSGTSRRLHRALFVLLLAVYVVLGGNDVFQPPPRDLGPLPPPPSGTENARQGWCGTDEAKALPAPPPPIWPALAGEALLLLSVAGFGLVRGARVRRARARVQRLRKLDALPWPRTYRIDASLKKSPFAPLLLEDLANALDAGTEEGVGRQLDVEASIDGTILAGGAPTLLFRRGRIRRALVVLVDESIEMRPFRQRVSALLDGLRQRGIAMDLWLFQGVPFEVSRELGDPPLRLGELARHAGGSAVLVISSGSGLRYSSPVRLRALGGVLDCFSAQVWLTPFDDPSLWPAELARFVARGRAFSLNAGGLRAAAMAIHGLLARPSRAVDGGARPAQADIWKMRALVGLVPAPNGDVPAAMRERFLPQVSDDVLVSVDIRAERENRAALVSLARAEPEVVRGARRFVLEMLDRASPTAAPEVGRESAAELRRRRDWAILALYDAELRPRALNLLHALKASPIADEVVTGLAAREEWATEVERASSQAGPARAPRAPATRDERIWPPPFEWPSWKVLTVGLALAVPTAALLLRPGLTGAPSTGPRTIEGYQLTLSDEGAVQRLHIEGPESSPHQAFVFAWSENRNIEPRPISVQLTLLDSKISGDLDVATSKGDTCFRVAARARDAVIISKTASVSTAVADRIHHDPSTLHLEAVYGEGIVIPPGEWQSFQARVLDSSGTAVPGVEVAWQTPALGARTYVGVTGADGISSATQLYTSFAGGSFVETAALVDRWPPGGAWSLGPVKTAGTPLQFHYEQHMVKPTEELSGTLTMTTTTYISATTVTIRSNTKITLLSGARLQIVAGTLILEGPATIDGRGVDGPPGAPGAPLADWKTANVKDWAASCVTSLDRGSTGGTGAPGGKGATVALYYDVLKGSPAQLDVRVEGGRGGKGGAGGRGRACIGPNAGMLKYGPAGVDGSEGPSGAPGAFTIDRINGG